MKLSRRAFLAWGGSTVLAASQLPLAFAASALDIRMQGRADGSHVWFDPIGLHIEPGQSVRWINLDPGNSHTSTAYHPSLLDRPLRMPEAAKPWNSDYLLPNESFTLTLAEPGIYDYYCQPHEHAGMVGRIVVGTPPPRSWIDAPAGLASEGLPAAARDAFPSVADIIAKGMVRRA